MLMMLEIKSPLDKRDVKSPIPAKQTFKPLCFAILRKEIPIDTSLLQPSRTLPHHFNGMWRNTVQRYLGTGTESC